MAVDLANFSIDGFAFPLLGWLDTGFFVNEFAFPMSSGNEGYSLHELAWNNREFDADWNSREVELLWQT